MRKIFSISLALCLIIGVTACAGGDSEEPRIMDTFVESYDFDGITMIPFCTSSSSGIGRSGKNLADNAGSGNWLEGARFGSGASEDEIRTWVEDME